MSTHTPGPWEVRSHNKRKVADMDETSDWTVYGANLEMVCMEAHRNPCAAADAQLIAAAPQLLEALQYIANGALAGNTASVQLDDAIELARRAIAKATGEQS